MYFCTPRATRPVSCMSWPRRSSRVYLRQRYRISRASTAMSARTAKISCFIDGEHTFLVVPLYETSQSWKISLLCFHRPLFLLYFMLFGSLSENNEWLSLDSFTVSSSEIIIHRTDWQFSDIFRRSIVCYSSVRLANYLTKNPESWVHYCLGELF